MYVVDWFLGRNIGRITSIARKHGLFHLLARNGTMDVSGQGLVQIKVGVSFFSVR
jgi:hypothetical protein